MGGMSGSQGSQVYYDPDMGQYYTQPQTNSRPNFGSLSGGSLGGALSGGLSNLGNLGIVRGGERTYLNNFNQSPALQQQAPYQYADTSIAALFPMIQNALQTSQGTQGGALDGLLSGVAQGAIGEASSGAGRFL
jgi:hypothetical protein